MRLVVLPGLDDPLGGTGGTGGVWGTIIRVGPGLLQLSPDLFELRVELTRLALEVRIRLAAVVELGFQG